MFVVTFVLLTLPLDKCPVEKCPTTDTVPCRGVGHLDGLAGNKVGVADPVDGAHSELVGPAAHQPLDLVRVLLRK